MESKINDEQLLARTKCQYKIEVKTANVKNAGTDDNVYIQIFGEVKGKGTTEKRETKSFKLDNSSDNFEKNQTDTFFKDEDNVGELTHIIVVADKKGDKPGWLIDFIRIIVNDRISTFTNTKKIWLTADDHGNLTELLLTVDKK